MRKGGRRMPLDNGAAQLREVALRLKAADTALWRTAARNIRVATAPAAERVRQSARGTLPREGGLNEWVAEAVIKTSVTTGARTAAVTLRMRKTGHDLKSIDAGIVRHPTWGNRKNWAVTHVKPGFWTEPLQGMRPEIAAAVLVTAREVAAASGFH